MSLRERSKDKQLYLQAKLGTYVQCSLPISTPRPLSPHIRTLETAIFFMASWPSTYLDKNIMMHFLTTCIAPINSINDQCNRGSWHDILSVANIFTHICIGCRMLSKKLGPGTLLSPQGFVIITENPSLKLQWLNKLCWRLNLVHLFLVIGTLRSDKGNVHENIVEK